MDDKMKWIKVAAWLVMAVGFAVVALTLSGCATTAAEASHTTIEADGSSETIKFRPAAKALFGKIEEAKQDAVMEVSEPDGYTYRLASGSHAKGMDSTATTEMIAGIVSGFMQALPEIAPMFLEGYLGNAQLNANKPQTNWLQDLPAIMAELREILAAMRQNQPGEVLTLPDATP